MVATAPPGNRSPRTRSVRVPSVRAQQAEAARFRRSMVLIGLSFVAPGSGQLVAGNKRVGRIALSIWAGVVVVTVLVLWLVPLDDLAGFVVRPWLLRLFELVTFGVAIAWIALLVDSWRLGHPPGLSRPHRLVLFALTVTLCGLIVVPLLVTARYASAVHDAVVALFPSDDGAVVGDGRLNVLLIGADAGKGRDGVRPDSINLVSIDVRSARSMVVSLPRNLEKARFPEDSEAAAQFPAGFTGEGDRGEWLLNATWTYGEAHPTLFPGEGGPGINAVKQAVEGTLGLPVHYSVVVDLDGFRDLVDALGGITIRVADRIPIGEGGEVIEPGLRTLDGYETLWYARSRTGASDYARMSRQRCVLGALLHKADPATVLRNFTALAEASTSLVTTDIPHDQLPDLIDLALRAKDLPVTSLQLVPPLIVPADPDYDVIAEEVDRAIEASFGDPRGDGTPAAAEQAEAAAGEASTDGQEKVSEPSAAAPTAVDLSSVCSYE